MKLAIIGSRGFKDYDHLVLTLETFFADWNDNEDSEGRYIGSYKYMFHEIISGGATGADKLAARFAKENNIKLTEFIPDWSAGKGAGFARNHDIINPADFVLAFWNGSNGTKHSLGLAKKLKKPTMIIYF